jgi:hypothetical protein
MRRAPLRLLRGGWDRLGAAGWIGRPVKESDVPPDEQVVNSREYGGPSGQSDKGGDAGTTTGTVNNGLFVGRAVGDDLGYVGDTGAEIRASVSPPSQEDPKTDSGGGN